ncbi:MAG: hypothetical protein HRU20_22200, partial [Pseudomonadales bacterium]|nr:hypothetical protein [Pseudomonadales bacterium]
PEESAWEAFRVDIDSKELQQLSLFGEDVRSLSLSPDGQYLALSIMSGNSNIGDNNDNLTQFHTDLYIVEMQKAQAIWDAGEKLTKADMSVLVSSPAAEQFWYEELNWNPVMPEDGGEPVLAYTKTWRYDEDEVSYTHVYSIRADGLDQQLIIENKDMPVWDFSGESLCFLDLSCYALSEAESIQLNVSDITLEVASATVSPDGEFILFEVGDENRKAGMARLSIEAENPGVVIAGGNAYEPRWSPKPVQ